MQPSCCACRSLDAEEKELIWRFRWSLTSEPRALTKFLACVDWSDILVRRRRRTLRMEARQKKATLLLRCCAGVRRSCSSSPVLGEQ